MYSELAAQMEEDAAGAAEGSDVSGELSDKVRRLIQLRDELRETEARVKEIRAEYDDLRKKDVPEAFQQAGMSSLRLDTGELAYLSSDLHVSVKKQDRPAMHQWLRENGLGDLITESVHYQTLRAAMRERKEQGGELPPQVGYFPYQKVNIRKS